MSRETTPVHDKHKPKRSARFEVTRERRDGRPPDVETHYGFDYAKVAALAYALAGRTGPYTSRVQVRQVWLLDGVRSPIIDIDDIDERVASVFLNQVDLPKAWSESEGLAALG